MTTNSELGQQPSRMKPTDLAQTFRSSPRSAGLRGLEPIARRVEVPSDVAADADAEPNSGEASAFAVPQAAVSEPSVKETRQVTRRIRERRPDHAADPREAGTSSGVRTIVAYISVPVRERLRVNAGDLTYTEVVLAALDATHAKLADRFTAATRPANSLFAGPVRSTPRRHEEPHVQVSLRPMGDDLAVIDRLVEEMNASSRSALINAALDEYLS
jgi:hypothetical protein